MRRLMVAGCWLAAVVVLASEETQADDWPQWHGPDRSNVSKETGLLKEWPKDGPPLLWKAEGLGHGVASVSVAGGRVYTLGYREDNEFVIALDAKDGKEVWSSRIGPAVKESGVMRWLSQRSPMVDGDRLYAFTAAGELICLETAGGKERWRKDYIKDFGGERGPWGFCDYPVVDGEKLICTPGGATATFVALNKLTGEVLWKSAVPGGGPASHSAMVLVEAGSVRQYVNVLRRGPVGIAAADGKLLWRYDRFASAPACTYPPVVRGDLLFCVNGYGTGCALLKLAAHEGGIKLEELYFHNHNFQNWMGSAILLGEHVYLCRANGLPTCIELKTGQPAWGPVRTSGSGQASMTCADGHLYLRYQEGKVVLVEATPEGYKEKGSFQPARTSTEPTWTTPVIADGRLYLRDQDLLLCYDVKAARRRRTRAPDAIFVSTPQDVVEKMLEVAGVRKTDLVYDLGCGDGRIVVTAAKKYGCKAVGYDVDPECVKMALENVKKHNLGQLVTIEQEDVFTLDLSKADVVTLYLLPKLNVKLIPQLEKLKPGSRIVSHEFAMEGVRPEKVVTVRSEEDDLEHRIYLWTTPLKRETKEK